MDLNVNEIFETARNDPTLFSTIDIEKLLSSIEKDKNDYLENKTMIDVNTDIFNKINDLNLSETITQEMCEKLIGYRYVDEIHELHKGKYIRWTRNGNRQLTNGGIVVDIKFLDNGTHVLTMNSKRRFTQIKFDNCLIFQKLSVEEQLILMAYEHMSKT
jgi:hypothetical protein